jgi:hypothetical protein
VDENLGVAITIAVAAYLVAYAFMTTQIVTTTDDATSIITRYRAVVGESPPTAFQPILGAGLAGRRVQAFMNMESGQTLLLYHEGRLAGRADAKRLELLPDKTLDFLKVPFETKGRRSAMMLHLPVELRVIEIEMGHGSLLAFIANFEGNTGRPALLCLMGDSESTVKMARTMFREQ